MSKSYYQKPSVLGKPILDLFLNEDEYKEDCIRTIWYLETDRKWGFNMLNVIKYLWRLGQKDPDPVADIDKAIQYLLWASNETKYMLSSIEPLIYKAIEECHLLKQKHVY